MVNSSSVVQKHRNYSQRQKVYENGITSCKSVTGKLDRLDDFFDRWVNVRSDSWDLYSGGSISWGIVIFSRSGVGSR